MTDPTTGISDQEIRDWLLQRLDARRNAAIEEQLFVDRGLADRVDGVECDLIDDCAHGRLPADDMRIVRSRDAWRVRFAEALGELQRPGGTMAPRRVRTSSRRRLQLGVAIAASVVGVFVAFHWKAIAPTATEQVMDTTSLPIVTLLLEQRRGVVAPLALPTYDGNVRIQAEIDDGSSAASSRYELSVAAGGHVLFVARGLEARNAGPYRFVEAVIPASFLGPEMRRISVSEDGDKNSSASWDVRMPASR